MKAFPSILVSLVTVFIRALLAASALSTPDTVLQKRVGPFLDFGHKPISYQALTDGHFSPDVNLRPSMQGPLLLDWQVEQPFHEGIPMYPPDHDDIYDLRKLQRGYTDYGTIHIIAPYNSDKRHLTITKNSQGVPLASTASDDVAKRATEFFAAKETFGETAAIAAYGHKLDPVARETRLSLFKSWFKKKKPPHDWNGVQVSTSASSKTPLEAARDALNEHRSLKFRALKGGAEMVVRLLEDGSQKAERIVSDKAHV